MAQRPIMVMGCTSDAGKSFLTTALCRHFADRGLRVAPFKAQNMSTNAAVTADGLEIGRAQYVQALAARTSARRADEPGAAETKRGHAQQGHRPGPLRRGHDRAAVARAPTRLWPIVQSSLHGLIREFDQVVIEGAGSPAEINLRASDIVNMSVALECGGRRLPRRRYRSRRRVRAPARDLAIPRARGARAHPWLCPEQVPRRPGPTWQRHGAARAADRHPDRRDRPDAPPRLAGRGRLPSTAASRSPAASTSPCSSSRTPATSTSSIRSSTRPA